MNESALMIVLRLIHIFSGIFWAGGVALLVGFILPAQLVMGRGAMPFMQELMMRRRLRAYVTIAMILTLLSGLAMYARLAITTHGQWPGSNTGKVVGIGAFAAIIAAGIGGSVGASTARKMSQLGARIHAGGGPPTDEQVAEAEAIISRFRNALRIVALLLIIAIAAMGSARYL
jgi:uncharacterized membrane protein